VARKRYPNADQSARSPRNDHELLISRRQSEPARVICLGLYLSSGPERGYPPRPLCFACMLCQWFKIKRSIGAIANGSNLQVSVGRHGRGCNKPENARKSSIVSPSIRVSLWCISLLFNAHHSALILQRAMTVVDAYSSILCDCGRLIFQILLRLRRNPGPQTNLEFFFVAAEVPVLWYGRRL
jgi:hypothetical protein